MVNLFSYIIVACRRMQDILNANSCSNFKSLFFLHTSTTNESLQYNELAITEDALIYTCTHISEPIEPREIEIKNLLTFTY